MAESAVQSEVIKYLEAQGAYVINPKTSTYSKKGTPDIALCFKGLFISIEFKEPGKTPKKLQLLRLQQVRNAGGIALWTDNIKDVKELVDEISRFQCDSKFGGREAIFYKGTFRS